MKTFKKTQTDFLVTYGNNVLTFIFTPRLHLLLFLAGGCDCLLQCLFLDGVDSGMGNGSWSSSWSSIPMNYGDTGEIAEKLL